MTLFDLSIFPLSLESGREQYELPGLLVLSAPRKAARMRAQDQLLLYCRWQTTLSAGTKTHSALTPAQQQEILNRLTETYFSFSGSVTAGLRAVAVRLNDFLLNRNLKAAQEGQTVGILNLAAIHGDALIVAHAGMTHSFLLGNNQVQHFDDGIAPRAGGNAGRGLGVSRAPALRFYQTELASGDVLLICAEPPAAWTPRLFTNSPRLSFDYLRRRLLSDSGEDFQAVAVRFQPGKGQISYWRPSEPASPSATTHRPAVMETAANPVPPAVPSKPGLDRPAVPSASADITVPDQEKPDLIPPAPVLPEVEGSGGVNSEVVPDPAPAAAAQNIPSTAETESTPEFADPVLHSELDQSLSQPAGVFLGGISTGQEPVSAPPLPRPSRPAPSNPRQAAVHAETAGEGSTPLNQSSAASRRLAARKAEARTPQVKQNRRSNVPPRPRGEGLRRSLAAIWQKGHAARAKTGSVFTKAAATLPKRHDADGYEIPFFNISPGVMLVIAFVIPLVVAAVAATVYFRAGRAEQYQALFLQAQQYALQAGQQTDQVQQRKSWELACQQVIKAETYDQTDASAALKKQSCDELDNLQGFVRLSYQPAVTGGFSSDVHITRIVAALNDIYLLDSSQGRILRLYRTGSGYEVDPRFNCGPGKAGNAIVGPLIDIVQLPPNNDMRATVMGMDGGGNLVYCSPSQDGFTSRPLALPDAGWGSIVGMALYGDSLYVLDPKSNAVYRYDGSNAVFTAAPHLYFDSSIPQMNDVIDLAADQEFLYMLHVDGRMTVCESGGFAFAATKCTDPMPYGDMRPGNEPAPLSFPGAHFTQIDTTQPPDPAIFALDDANKSIYHLSLRRLNLQRQYRAKIDSDFPLPNSAPTAFAITPNRRALLAFGNQIFFAPIP